jgi:type I restriction enzyme M protein
MRRVFNSRVIKKERKLLKGQKHSKTMNDFTKSLESSTRKKIDLILNSLGWNTNEDSPQCNVFTERAKTKEQNKKFNGNKPDYVLYKSGTDEPIAIIEAKRKGQSIEKAIEQGVSKYANPLGIKIVFAVDGAFIKSFNLDAKKELVIDNDIVTELMSEERLLRFIKEGYSIEEVPEQVKHTRDELIRIFKWANELLRKEGLRNLDRFVEFSNILFIKIISEIEDDREKNGFRRQLDKHLCWDSFSDMKDSTTMLNYINDTVLKNGLAKEYNHSDDIFQEKLKIKNPNTVKDIVDKLSNLKLINTESEIKGDAFEYFLKNLASGNDLGEYFTPRHIVKLMVTLINPKYGNTVFDPFCGTGGFLIEAFRQIKRGIDEKDNKLMKFLKEQTIFGVELTDTYKIAKMNMIITGDGHNNIIQDDTAKKEYWNNKDVKNVFDKMDKKGFDIVLANIPYGQTTDYGHLYPIPSNQGDSIFIQHIIEVLNKGGKCGVIIPEGFLFKGEHKKIREYLLRECDVEAVISLPAGVFMPYTMAKTDILIFEKGRPTKKVWFYVLKDDGFELATKRRKISKNDIPDLINKWIEKPDTERSWNVEIDKIIKNDFILEANSYKQKVKSLKSLIKFSEFLKEVKRPVKVEFTKDYKQVKVKLYGNGAVLRKIEQGSRILTKNQFIAKYGDLIVSKIDARNGAFAIIPLELDNSLVSADFPLFEIDESKIRKEYLQFFLRYYNLKEFLSKDSKGTTNRQRIVANDFLNLEIPLPSLEYQDMAITRLRGQEEILINLNKTLNSLREGFIEQIVFDNLENPNLIKILDLSKKTQYGMTQSVMPEVKGIPFIRITDIDSFGKINCNELPEISASKEDIEKYKVNEGDLLVARSGSIGKCTVINKMEKNTVFASYLIRFILDKTIVEPKYILYYLLSNKGQLELQTRATKMAQTNINANQIASIEIPIPSLEKQREIIKEIDEKSELITMLNQNIESSKRLIKAIITNLFTIK